MTELPPDLDDHDKPFDENTYFAKLGPGFEPEPHKKQRERHRKQQSFTGPDETMLELRPASRWIKPGSKQRPPRELFGSLWRSGEVAVLFGAKGSGKSLLAVQIAESVSEPGAVATGFFTRPTANRRLPTAPKILYLDFEHTEQQFTERYSAPSPIPGKLPITQKFAFHRTQVVWEGEVPEAFKGDANTFLVHSIFEKFREANADVLIIDNISYVAKNIANSSSCLRTMKTLKLWAQNYGLSILLIAHAKGRRGLNSSPCIGGVAAGRGGSSALRPIELEDIAAARALTDLADSVFCIGRSTAGPDYRYVKHLASRSAPVVHDASSVMTFEIKGGSLNSPPCIGGVAEGRGGSSVSSLITTRHSPLPPSPFMHLESVGLSAESDHLRDYAAEARDAERREKEALRKLRVRSSRAALADGIIDGSYRRYLLGD